MTRSRFTTCAGWLAALEKSISPAMRTVVILALLALAHGCGNSDEARVAGNGADSPSPAAATSSAATVEESPGTGEPAEPDGAENDPELARQAREAFAALTATGVLPDDWASAQETLFGLGADAVPALVDGLGSADPHVRETAASVLAMIGPESIGAESALLRALGDESVHVRANAATALCVLPGHDSDVIPVLTELLLSDDRQLRQIAATNLSNFGPEAAPFVAELTAVLESGPADVLTPVAEILGRIGPEAQAAAPRLQQIAFEEEGDAKRAATAALEQIKPGGSE